MWYRHADQHVRGMVSPLTEHESKELFRQYCRPGGHRQNFEIMKQYISRRRRCWMDIPDPDGPSDTPQ